MLSSSTLCFEAIPLWLSKHNASPFSAEQELGVLYLCLLFQELRQRKENWLEPNEDAAREAAMKVTIILLVDYLLLISSHMHFVVMASSYT